MSNFDKLSLTNENVENEASVSVIEPKSEEVTPQKKRLTVFSAFLANFRQDKDLIYPAKNAVLPNLKNTIYTFITLVFLSALFVAMWYFIKKTTFIPVALVFLTMSVPFLIMVFYYDFNIGQKIPLSKLLILSIIGALINIALTQLKENVLYLFFYQAVVDSLIMPIITNVSTFIAIILVANFFNAKSVKDYFAIVSFLIMGFVICENVSSSFLKMFISTKLNDDTLYNIKVIINNEQMLTQSMRNVLSGLLFDYIVLPLLYSTWGTIDAYLVYYMIDSKRKSKKVPKSMYLLIMLVIILNVLALMNSSLLLFNILFKFISTAVSLFIVIKILNFSLEEES